MTLKLLRQDLLLLEYTVEMMTRIPRLNQASAITCLDDPTRRAIFDFVRHHDGDVTKNDVASSLDLARSTAAFHLDRLQSEGLLTARFERLGDRVGPGAGRPTKLYHLSVHEVGITIPTRNYDLAADIMATAIEDATAAGGQSPTR